MIIRWAVASAIVAAMLAAPARATAQDLASARQLYASADYKGALTMLDTLVKGSPTPQDRQSIDLYRTLCLVALGSTADANAAVEAMITRDPLYHANDDDLPPRLRTMFSEARKKLLPSIIQQRYLDAKAVFDRGDYRAATEGFTQVLLAMSDPDIAVAAKQPPLSDLRMLATGFNDLTIRALAPPPAATPLGVPPVSAPAPPAATNTPASTAVAATPPASPPPARANAGRAAGPGPATARGAAARSTIYMKDDPGVAEPVTVRQTMPGYPGRLNAPRNGIVEVVINETGSVESAAMLQPVDPEYDRLVLNAARTWAYQPARRDGAPVKFRKRIQIAISPGT
jgi:TonB family protein